MSENSELTKDEFSGARSAVVAAVQNPSIPRDRLYRIIRPRRDDDE
jgi:hypothetical protein